MCKACGIRHNSLKSSSGDVIDVTEVASETSYNAGGSEAGEGGQDTRGLSTKEYERQMAALRKENFQLKLKLYFHEEQHGISQEPHMDLRKANLDLKVENESLKSAVYDKQQLVSQASEMFQDLERVYEGQLGELRARQAEADERIGELEQVLDEYQARCEELEGALVALQGPPADMSVLCDLAFPSSAKLNSREASCDRAPAEKTPDNSISNVTYNTIHNTLPNTNNNVQSCPPQFISLSTGGGDVSSNKVAEEAKKEAVVLRQEVEVARKEAEIRANGLNQEMGRRHELERQLQERQQQLDSAIGQLQLVQPEMTLKTEELTMAQKHLSEQDTVIEEGKSQLEQQNKILVEIQITLGEKEKQIAELEAVLEAERNRLLELETRIQTEVEQRISMEEEKFKLVEENIEADIVNKNKLVELENKMDDQIKLEKCKLVEMEKKMKDHIETENMKAIEMKKKMEFALLSEKNKAIEMEKSLNNSIVALEGFTVDAAAKNAEVAKLTKENRRLERKCRELVGELRETLDALGRAKWEAENGGGGAGPVAGMTEEENESLWAELDRTKTELGRLRERCSELTCELERATSSKHDCATVEAQLGAATATLAALRLQLQGALSTSEPTDGGVSCATLLKQLVQAVETQNTKKSQDVNVNVTMQTNSSKSCQDESDTSTDGSPKKEVNYTQSGNISIPSNHGNRESSSSSFSTNDLNQCQFSLPNQTDDCNELEHVCKQIGSENQPSNLSSHALNIPNKSYDIRSLQLHSSDRRGALLSKQIQVLCEEFIQNLNRETNSYEEKIIVYQDEFAKMASSLRISNGACEALQKRLEELSQFLEKVLEMDALGEIDLSKMAGVDKSVLYKSMDESRRLSISVSKFNTSLRSMSMNNRKINDDASKSKIMQNYSSLFDFNKSGDITALTEASLSVTNVTMAFDDTSPIPDLPAFPSYTTLVKKFSDEMSAKLMNLDLHFARFDSSKTETFTGNSDQCLLENVQNTTERSKVRDQSIYSVTSHPELSGNFISSFSNKNNLNESVSSSDGVDCNLRQNGMVENQTIDDHYDSLDMSNGNEKFRPLESGNASISSFSSSQRDADVDKPQKLELSMYRNSTVNDVNVNDIGTKSTSTPVLKEWDENVSNHRRESTSSDRFNNNIDRSNSDKVEQVFATKLGEDKENYTASDVCRLQETLEESIQDYDQLPEQLNVALAACSARGNGDVAQLTHALLSSQEALQILCNKSELSEQENANKQINRFTVSDKDESSLKQERFEQCRIQKLDVEADLRKTQDVVQHLKGQLSASQAKLEELAGENGRIHGLSDLANNMKIAYENGLKENQVLASRLIEANSHVKNWENVVEKNEIVNNKRSELITKERDQLVLELKDANDQIDVLHGKLLTLKQQKDDNMGEEKRVQTVRREEELFSVVEQLKYRCQVLETNLDESRNIQCLNDSSMQERVSGTNSQEPSTQDSSLAVNKLVTKNDYLEAQNKSLLKDKKELLDNLSRFSDMQKLQRNRDITLELVDSEIESVPANIYDKLKKNYAILEEDYAHLQKLYGIVQEEDKKTRKKLHDSEVKLHQLQLQIDVLDNQYQEKLESIQQEATDRLSEMESHLSEVKARYGARLHTCEARLQEEQKMLLASKEKLMEEQKRVYECRDELNREHKIALECEGKLTEEKRNCEWKLRELETRCVFECEQLEQKVSKLVSQLEVERATKESLRSELVSLTFSGDVSRTDNHLSLSDLGTGLLDRNLSAGGHDRKPFQRSPHVSHRSYPEIRASNISPKSSRSFTYSDSQTISRMSTSRIPVEDETSRISPRIFETRTSNTHSDKSPMMSPRRLQRVEDCAQSQIKDRLEGGERCTVSRHGSLVSENGHLGARVDELSVKLENTEARLMDTLQKLSSETQRKQKVERAIGRELLKTHKVLKLAEDAAVKRKPSSNS